jgi:hypothetical protein
MILIFAVCQLLKRKTWGDGPVYTCFSTNLDGKPTRLDEHTLMVSTHVKSPREATFGATFVP